MIPLILTHLLSDTVLEPQTRLRTVKSGFTEERGGGKRLERVQPTLAEEVPGSGVSMCWGGRERTGATYKSIPCRGHSGFQRIKWL